MSEQQLARFFDDILGISAPADGHGTGLAEDVAESGAETAEDRSSAGAGYKVNRS